MKFFPKIAFSGLFALFLLGASAPAQAQVNININPPSWGPAAPAGTRYYYVPEYDGYYDLQDRRYIVKRDGRWTRLSSLNGYNSSNFHPVVLNYRGTQPWVRIEEHRTKYKKGHPHGMPPGQAKKMRGNYSRDRVIIVGDNRNDGRHDDYRGHPGNGNGNGKGHGKGKH
jgi:hypothetical protein